MIGREFEAIDLDSRDSEKSLARRFFPRIFLGILVTIGVVIVLLVISNQVQAGDYGVKVQYSTPTNGIGNVTPGVDFQYTVDIINNGTSNPGEDINFTVELDPVSVTAGWTVTPSGTTIIPNLLMGPGNKVTEIVTVRAPIDAQFGDSAVINITVDVIGHKGEVGCLDSLQLRANVVRDYEVLMTTAADIKTGDPGEEVPFEIKITNQGNLNDTFSFSATGLELGEWNVADVTLEPQEFIYVYYNRVLHDARLKLGGYRPI